MSVESEKTTQLIETNARLTDVFLQEEEAVEQKKQELEKRVDEKIVELEEWKNTAHVSSLPVDFTFTKVIPTGTSLNGNVLWNPRDLDAEDKSSYIILYDGADNPDLKYADGAILTTGTYIGQIDFSTANKGGAIYGAKIGFILTESGHTNNALLEQVPFSMNSHAFNGAKIRVESRSLSTGNTYKQYNQILLYIEEGNTGAVATEDILVTLKLKRII